MHACVPFVSPLLYICPLLLISQYNILGELLRWRCDRCLREIDRGVYLDLVFRSSVMITKLVVTARHLIKQVYFKGIIHE